MGLGVRNITVSGRIAEVSVRCRRGMVTAICGPNGAGKSTLLSCLAGLIRPDVGDVLIGGRPLSKVSRAQKGQWIGYLPQAPEVAWDVSVEVLVSLGRLPWRGAPARETQAAIDEAILAMDLEALRRRPMSQLSGGERARALMARVLATQPGWILADEPFANLDLAHAASLMRRFRQQAEAGRGVVLVLHDLATAMNHADQVVVLKNGVVEAEGPPEFALASNVIHRVWNCPARWLGEPGERALSLGQSEPIARSALVGRL